MFTEQRYKSRIDRLIRQWVEYRNLVVNRYGATDVTPEEENRFLALKGKIAEDLTVVATNGAPTGVQEVVAHQRSLGEFLNRIPTLAAEAPPNEREREDFEREWHRQFLFLNRLKGLPPRREAKAAVSKARPVTVTAPHFGPRYPFMGWLARFVLRLAFLVVAAWLVIRFFPWERVGLRPSVPGGQVSGTVGGAINSARDGLSNFNLPTLGGMFQPVVDKYGPELSAIMVGALLVAVGYWIFIRMK